MDERVNRYRDHAGLGNRQHHAEQRLNARTSVDLRRLLQFARHALKKRAEHNHAHGNGQRHIRNDQRSAGIEHLRLGEEEIQRNDDHDAGDHLSKEQAYLQDSRALEVKPRKTIAGQHGDRQRQDHDAGCDDHAVEKCLIYLFILQNRHIVSRCRRIRNDFRRIVKQLGGRLDGGGEHPDSRENRDDNHHQEDRIGDELPKVILIMQTLRLHARSSFSLVMRMYTKLTIIQMINRTVLAADALPKSKSVKASL